jgi:hypothetical protein
MPCGMHLSGLVHTFRIQGLLASRVLLITHDFGEAHIAGRECMTNRIMSSIHETATDQLFASRMRVTHPMMLPL